MHIEDGFDRELRAQVAPQDWTQPAPNGRYNLVVLGGGAAGLVAAAGAAGLGGKVALIERARMGGDCLNHGCVPSKALLRSARVLAEARRAQEFGVSIEEAHADFGAIMERMRRLRAGIARHDSAQRFRDLGVDVFLGEGCFAGDDRVRVDGQELAFSRALIATGGQARPLPVPGLAEAGFLTNTSLFDLQELPQSLVVVGAGAIGCEMAQAFARFGSKVSIVALDPRVLPREDPAASELLTAALQAEGIELQLGASLERVEVASGEKIVHWRRGEERGQLHGQQILLAVGRQPHFDSLGLDSAGIRTTDRGILQVDEHLRTTNRRVFAAGDVAGRWQFTHAADAMARLVLRNALFAGRGRASALTIPWCTFTSPEVAHVGLYEHESELAGTELSSLRIDWSEIDRAVLDGERAGFAKAVFEKKSGRLRGATVVAEHAGEILGEACLAVSQRMKVSTLASVVRPYPTQSMAWGRIGDMANRNKLTPSVASLFRTWLRWRR